MTMVTLSTAHALEPHQIPDLAKPDFAALVGYDGWFRLKPDIRRRFGEEPGDRPIRYVGTMHQVEASVFGLALAQLCRLWGSAFALYRGRDVPVDIVLRANPGDGAIIWERIYHYPDHPTTLVRSIKRKTARGLVECVGGGFAMEMSVYEREHALHFDSRRYLWRLGRLTVPLPHFLAPGLAQITHRDLGGGSFRFVMSFRHRLLGTLFYQDGVFREEGLKS